MNMHFQLNLTAGDVVAEAKLRIYKLPQEDLVTSMNGGDFNEDEVREKKIRISVFYYMKSLKTYRCECLMRIDPRENIRRIRRTLIFFSFFLFVSPQRRDG